MDKLESRLANQSDSDSLIANEAYDMNFNSNRDGFTNNILPNEMGNPCVKTCQFVASKIHL